MNENWPKWIKLSLTRYFESNKGNLGFIFEGDTEPVDENVSRFELRIDGPDIEEYTKSEFELTLIVNCLVCTIDNPSEIFKHEENVGYVQSKFPHAFTIFDTSGTNIGCLNLDSRLAVTDFGKKKQGYNAKFSTIEAQYRANWVT